jgi:hypothetical protein
MRFVRVGLALSCATVVAACGSVEKTAAPTTTVPAAAALDECVLPRLPAPGSVNGSLQLDGPAVNVLRGGAARAGFELDGGDFTLTPPGAGDQPSVSATQAECAALASLTPNGQSILGMATAYGVAAGFGRVSIAPALTARTSTTTYVARSGANENTNPRLPGPTAYSHRLAWIVVVKEVLMYSEPPEPVAAPDRTTTTAPSTPSYGYVVFVVDARTGSGALVYTEAQAGPITAFASPTVDVPAEMVSVPWTLVSRSHDGYAGRVTASVLSCDGIPDPVWIDHGGAGLAVVVQRPVGPPCGRTREVTLPVVAAEVTADLPPHIAHDPIGPVVTVLSANAQPSRHCSTIAINGRPAPGCPYTGPGATPGVLRQMFDADNDTTVHVGVDDVLTVGPLHAPGRYPALPVASSDPGVLGPLDGLRDSEVHEFRAWRRGQADLFTPERGWTVHIIVD